MSWFRRIIYLNYTFFTVGVTYQKYSRLAAGSYNIQTYRTNISHNIGYKFRF